MDKEILAKNIGKLRTKYQRGLNNVYIWSSLAKEALSLASQDNSFLEKKEIIVPSKLETRSKAIVRTPEGLKKIVDDALACDLYYSIFVFTVSQVEAFLNDILTCYLRFDNRRLLSCVKGINGCTAIDIKEIVHSQTREDLIESLILKQLTSVFYASPKLQLEYLTKIVGVEIGEDVSSKWLEYKATRDIIVHNMGYANDTYIQKSGELARCAVGQKIPIEDQYYCTALATMKSLIGRVSSRAQASLR